LFGTLLVTQFLFSENSNVGRNIIDRSIPSQITDAHVQDTVLTVPSAPLTRPVYGDICNCLSHISPLLINIYKKKSNKITKRWINKL